jgi:hypothetical protein
MGQILGENHVSRDLLPDNVRLIVLVLRLFTIFAVFY